jgi:hypothetical protein
MMTWQTSNENLLTLVRLERERRRRQRAGGAEPAASFIAATAIEVVGDTAATVAPFALWPSQQQALETMERDRLVVFLKARQLGISWLVCGYALHMATSQAGQPILVYSQGQREANELIRRTRFLYDHHANRGRMPSLTKDNIGLLEWANGSRMHSLAATRKAGRSFTAALAILDEWAFMAWPQETLAAVKPTIDAGGKLFIISSADGMGTAYHQFWQAAERGANGYTPVFLPWSARPDRAPDWRDQKLMESGGDTASIYREYPANPIEAFTHAAGLVYDVWSDGPDDGNVSRAAEYEPGAGPLYWAVDDGYEGKLDPSTGQFAEGSAPRVFLLVQERGDGRLNVFYESYECKTLSDDHLKRIVALDYPDPEYAAVDSAAAELRGRIHNAGYYTRGKPQSIEESVKATRRMLAPDSNGWRRVLVHPRCKHLRWEMASYRRDPDTGKPIDAHNHGCDALRYLCWTKRLEG